MVEEGKGGVGGGSTVEESRMRVHRWLDISESVCMHDSTYIVC